MCLLCSFQEIGGPEPLNEDGSPFFFHVATPGVLFGKDSPPLKDFFLRHALAVYQSGKRKRSPGAAAPGAHKLVTRRVTQKILPSMAASGGDQSSASVLPGAKESDAPSVDQVTSRDPADSFGIGSWQLTLLLLGP